MGLSRGAVHLLLREAARKPFGGTILTLGRQHIYATESEVRRMAEDENVSLTTTTIELHREPSLAARGFLSDECLFRLLGFERSVRADVSNYEACEEIFDLNASDTPSHLQQRFDVVLDSGTIEHVFDIAAAMRHCCRMVKSGGRVIHFTPSSNCVEHGFYSVSPTLYADFYQASGFAVERVWLVRMPRDHERGTWLVYDYLGAAQRFIPLGRLDRAVWFTWSVATAGEHPVPAVPQQSLYVTTWQQATSSVLDPANASATLPKAARLLKLVERSPWLTRLAHGAIARWRTFLFEWRARTQALPFPFVGRF